MSKIPTRMFEVFPLADVIQREGDRTDDSGKVIGSYVIREQRCLIRLPGSEATHEFFARIPDDLAHYPVRVPHMIDPHGNGNGLKEVTLEGQRYPVLAFLFRNTALVPYEAEHAVDDSVIRVTTIRRKDGQAPTREESTMTPETGGKSLTDKAAAGAFASKAAKTAAE